MAPGRIRLHERDGSAASGAIPAIPPWSRHIVRRPHAYTPSRSEQSRKPRAAGARGQTCINEASALRAIASEKKTLHFALQFRQRRIQGLQARIDDDGPLRVQPIEMEAYGLPKSALDPIAHNGLADSAGNGKADPRTAGPRLPDAESREQRAGKARSLIIDPSEILRSQ